MKVLLKQDRLPKNQLRPSLLRPLYRSLRVAASTFEIEPEAEVSLLLTEDTLIRELNRDFRQIDKPTDVLSFSQEDPVMLGDIVISVETATRQAEAASWPTSSEIALLGTHGLLHLIGYEDELLEDAQEMETLTRAVLTQAGLVLPLGSHPFFSSFDIIG